MRKKHSSSTILLASNNPGKVAELQTLLADMQGLGLLTPADLGLDLEVVEDGSSYAENAAKKALAFSKASGIMCLADDSGLEVEALDNAPGLYSARYAPKKGADDADRRAFMLKQLKGKTEPWKAVFRSTVCVATNGGELHYAEGECIGRIIPEERGGGGFGYDPIFMLEGEKRTMAELGTDEKNLVSHRARAIIGIKPILKKILSSD